MLKKTALYIFVIFTVLFLSSAVRCYAASEQPEKDKKQTTTPAEKDKKNGKLKFSLKHKNIYASSSLSGKGADLATSYDTSIYEASLFKSTTVANGSLVTQNSRYPMASSCAFTSETFLDWIYSINPQMSAGLSVKVYTNSDTDKEGAPGSPYQRTSRVFGVMMPVGNFTGMSPGMPGVSSVPLPGFYVGLWNFFLSGKTENSSWKLEIGDLYPSMGKQYNKYLNMEHFLFRTPVSQMSIFGHWNRQDKYYSEVEPISRMPGYGAKISGRSGKVNYEAFTLKNDETPITLGQEFSYYGVRAGLADTAYRAALSFIGSEQDLFGNAAGSGVKNKKENLLGLEVEYDLTKSIGFYGAMGFSDYHEDGGRSGQNFSGNAFVGGIMYKSADEKFKADIRYQHVDPNFEPIGHHKNSIYPYNYAGPRAEIQYSWATEKEKKEGQNFVQLSYSDYSQINPDINTVKGRGANSFSKSDYLFPDDGRSDFTNGSAGHVKILSPELNVTFRNSIFELGGYYEKMNLEKSLNSMSESYNKQVDNFSLWGELDLIKNTEFFFGYREVNFSGSWLQKSNPYSFNQKATIPKIGINYDNERDFKVSAQVHFYSYNDYSNSITESEVASDNDWRGTLFLLETNIKF